jgi:hypothetical protein
MLSLDDNIQVVMKQKLRDTKTFVGEKCSAMHKLSTKKMNRVSKPVATIQNQR